jgi:signal transduction histidine kinase
MFTGHGDMDLAIKSIQHEATDFVTKPINENILEIALKRAQERISLRQKLREYTENLERRVEEKAKKLLEAERMAAVGQTIAGLSHTIKNIAGGLKGGMFILEQGLERDDRKYLREGWEMVKGNVDKVKNLSLDLLNCGKFTKIHAKMNDPNQPAREAFDLLKPISEEKGIDFKLVLNPDLEPFFFDADAIHRCLLNLVTNAIDACLDKKAGRRKKEVVLKTNKAGGWGVEYQVMDNGCGMDEAVENKIFQSFFSTKGTRGTGIGLMTVKTIIDQHQGTVEVETRLGSGSTFTMRLPDLKREE